MDIQSLNAQFAHSSAEEVLAFFLNEYKGAIALSSSLSYEDQVLTDMICEIDKSTRIFTLDTGRCFPETYSLIERTNERYGIKLEVYFLFPFFFNFFHFFNFLQFKNACKNKKN